MNFYNNLAILVLLCLSNWVLGQCPSNNLTLTTQAEIDAFAETYPNCSLLTHSLTLRARNINSLAGLSNITRIAGSMSIESTNLSNLAGLEKLTHIGGTLNLSANNALTTLSGLDNLVIIEEDLSFFFNGSLQNLSSLSKLTTVGRDFVLFENGALMNVDGLQNIQSIGGEFALIGNATLSHLDGLIGLNSIGGGITMDENSNLESIVGLNNLLNMNGGIEIQNSPKLVSCNIDILCSYILKGNNAFIANNGPSCSSVDEIAFVCDSSPPCTILVPAEITLLSENLCTGTLILFESNISQEIDIWFFGDGSADSGDGSFDYQASNIYEEAGTYTVTYIVDYGQGCQDTANYVLNIQSSSADFSYQVNGNSVILTADTSNTSNISNYLWTFGDGAVGSGISPFNTYTYQNAGTYTISLTTEGDCTSPTISKEVTVGIPDEENTLATCSDGFDNDLDGLIDAQDPDCACVLNGATADCCNDLDIVQVTISDDLNNQGTGSIHFFPIGGSSDFEDYHLELITNMLTEIDFFNKDGGIFIDSLSAGAYEFIFTDISTGCSINFEFEVENIDCTNFSISVEETENTCENITYTAILKNGTPPYQYNWTADGMNTDAIFVANPTTHIGTQLVTVTDANGCRNTQVFTVVPGTSFESNFSYELTADSILFTDLSTGNIISKQWTSNTPDRIFNNKTTLPPADSYRICLIVVNECDLQSTSCQTIIIEDPTGPVCPDGDIILTNNAEMLAFAAAYPNCVDIPGNLIVRGENITSLAPLSNLRSVRGIFELNSTSIPNLNGLEQLTNLGSFNIDKNHELKDLSGLTQLTHIEEVLNILNNFGLERINGFNNLIATTSIQFYGNRSLPLIDGFESLPYVEQLDVRNQLILEDLGSLGQLDSMGGLNILGNPLLSTCNVSSICAHLAKGKRASFANNLPACNTAEEIIAACEETPTEDKDQDGVLSDTDPDDNDPCVPNPIGMDCIEASTIDTPAIFSTYPILFDIADFTNCNTQKITAYLSGGFPYFYIESATSSILYNGNGATYCTNGNGLNCLEFYTVDEVLDTWECAPAPPVDKDQDGSLSDIDPDDNDPCVPDNTGAICETPDAPTLPIFLANYSFLRDRVDFDNCEGTTITLYMSSGYPYLYIESATSSILYNGSGVTYCTTGRGLNCLESYAVDELLSIWTCSEPVLVDQDQDGTLSDIDPDDTNPCVPDTSAVNCNLEPDLPDFLDQYAFLADRVDFNDCEGTKLTVYMSSGYPYVYVESASSSILYNGTGTLYCTSGRGLNCLEAYKVDEIITEWTCSAPIPIDSDADGILSDTDPDDNNPCVPNNEAANCDEISEGPSLPNFLEQYPFLSDHVDFNDCEGTTITLYISSGYPYLYVASASSGILFNASGTQYCTSGRGLNCLEAYAVDELLAEWTCTGSIIPSEPDCSKFSGTVFLDNCANNQLFYLIRSADGSILDPYFAPDVVFPFANGQRINFDYTIADFNSPCAAGIQAILLTCVEEAPPAPQDNSIFEDYPFLTISPATCNGEKITAYQSSGYPYVFVETADSGILYNGNGTKYCTNGVGLNCLEAYPVDEILKEWSCEEEAVATGDCSNHTGTIVFDNCDDGTPFFFVQLTDGSLLDIYFAAGINFEPIDGQQVKFDYTTVDFNSPCSIADQAVEVTCIELIQQETPSVIFDDFSWLADKVDTQNCSNEKITIYQVGAFKFMFIEKPTGDSLFFENGSFYCASSVGLDCVTAYELTEVFATWTCENIGTIESATPRTKTTAKNTSSPLAFTAFPNPTSGDLMIQSTTLQGGNNAQLSVFDQLGHLLLQVSIANKNQQVNIAYLPQGVYYLVLEQGMEKEYQRVVKR